MDGIVTSAIVGGIAGAVAVVLIAIFQKPRVCPECGRPAKKFRKPASRQQMLWGGWTCDVCGCESDRRGRKVKGPDEDVEADL